MKKLLSILSIALCFTLCLVGCSAKGNVTKLLDAQTTFAEEQAENLDLTKNIFSSGLETDYNLNKESTQKLDLRTLEKLIKTSNLTLTKLKVYLLNDDVVKKLSDGNVKDLIKLENAYYDNFKSLISLRDNLQVVIDKGSKNLKTDYENLNSQIKSTLVASANAGKKLTEMLKNVYKINITENQSVLNVGELEILTLEASANLVYFYSKIYIEETNLSSFGNLTPTMDLDDILEALTNISSSKFELTEAQFNQIKNDILLMQNYNNSLLSKSSYFSKVISSFSYETLKENAKTAYPNETDIEACVITYAASDKINIQTQSEYNFLADVISNNIAPAISNILNICNYISTL